jgi:glyceraldehyde 3-phosphate dehydrogenase
MTTRVAINGFGRIGRAVLKRVLEERSLDVVAVNDLAAVDNLAYLLRFDTVYGRFMKPVTVDQGNLVVGGRKLLVFSEESPSALPWKDLGVELVFECTGAFKRRHELEKHIQAGARIVLLSAPTDDADIETVVHGVNRPGAGTTLISCASCTTNCITPIIEIIGRRIGIAKAIMTTVHAYTSSQATVDGPSKHFRRGRAAAANLVPASTGAARATTRALPELASFDGIAIRAPIAVGSIADVTVLTSRPTSVDEVNAVFTQESDTSRYAGIVGVSRDPLVSSDIVGESRAAIVDLDLTRVVDGDRVKVMSWYDNEWGYASQMVREAVATAQPQRKPAA